MADPAAEFDLLPNPIRTGAEPTLDVVASGLTAGVTIQPAWVRLTEAFVKWIRFHFSAASRIEFPQLAQRVWTDTEDSPIVITSLAEWNPTKSGQRPCVLVDRLEQSKDMQNRGIGDQLQGIKPGRYAHFMNGQHVVHCLGGREGEADYLAAEVWRDLSRFAHILGPRLCLNKLLPVQIGKRVQLTNEHKQHYSTPVIINYHYCESWRVFATDEQEVMAIRTTLAGL